MDDLRYFFHCFLVRRVWYTDAETCDIFCSGGAALPDGIELVQVADEAISMALITNSKIDTECFLVSFRNGVACLPGRKSADHVYSWQNIRAHYNIKR
jgi:hypothetical protein